MINNAAYKTVYVVIEFHTRFTSQKVFAHSRYLHILASHLCNN